MKDLYFESLKSVLFLMLNDTYISFTVPVSGYFACQSFICIHRLSALTYNFFISDRLVQTSASHKDIRVKSVFDQISVGVPVNEFCWYPNAFVTNVPCICYI